MTAPDLNSLCHAEKDALILTLMARLEAAMQRIDQLQARIDELTEPGKTRAIPAYRRQRTKGAISWLSRSDMDHAAAVLAVRAAGAP
jgi:phage host-nuclease inhibitor protein Gam